MQEAYTIPTTPEAVNQQQDETEGASESLSNASLCFEDGEVTIQYANGDSITLGTVEELDGNEYANGVSLVKPNIPEATLNRIYPVSKRAKAQQPYLSVLAGPAWEEITLQMEDTVQTSERNITIRELLEDDHGDLPDDFEATFTEFQQFLNNRQMMTQ